MTCHTVTSRNRHETDSEEEMGCNNSKPVDGRKSSQMQRYQAVFDDLGINEVSALLMCAHMLRMRIGTRAPETPSSAAARAVSKRCLVHRARAQLLKLHPPVLMAGTRVLLFVVALNR